jgi:hypothetical protein
MFLKRYVSWSTAERVPLLSVGESQSGESGLMCLLMEAALKVIAVLRKRALKVRDTELKAPCSK